MSKQLKNRPTLIPLLICAKKGLVLIRGRAETQATSESELEMLGFRIGKMLSLTVIDVELGLITVLFLSAEFHTGTIRAHDVCAAFRAAHAKLSY